MPDDIFDHDDRHRRHDHDSDRMQVHVTIEDLHIHIHLHEEDEDVLLKKIGELQSKVTGDTASMKTAVENAKEGTS